MSDETNKKKLNIPNLFLKCSLVLVILIILALCIYPILLFIVFLTYALFLLILFMTVCILISIFDYKKTKDRFNIVVICIFSLILIILLVNCILEIDDAVKVIPDVKISDNILSLEQITEAINYPNDYRGYKIEISGRVEEIYGSGIGGVRNQIIWNLVYGNTLWFKLSITDVNGYDQTIIAYCKSKNKNVVKNKNIKIRGFVLGEYKHPTLFFRPPVDLLIEAEEID